MSLSSIRSALIVDDERDIRELVVMALTRQGLRIQTAANLAEARAQLDRHAFDLCLTDMRLPDGSGMDLVRLIAEQYPQMPVAMITAFGNVEAAVEALQAGAFDFVSKPLDLKVLRGLVQRALELRDRDSARESVPPPAPVAPASATVEATTTPAATRPPAQPNSEPAPDSPLARLSGESTAMQQLRQTVAKVARSQAPVLIHGESGTGKELVARTIHAEGGRAKGPFIPVNCGAIPAELMESEFFGHKKGSFTGAHADKTGLFQAAEGGTLFLDEIAELPLAMQVKLLRAIQEKSVRPVGGQAELPVDVRILSATHKDLALLVEDGSFRHDLYYRINVIDLPVPPLRQRDNDLMLLAGNILKKLAAQQGRDLPQLGEDARAAMLRYSFPGNVRELENVLERAMALADGDTITAADLRLPSHASTLSAAVPSPTLAAPAAPPPTPISVPQPAAAVESPSDLPQMMEELERQTIEAALLEHRYNKTKTAAALGITFRALRYKLKKLGID